MYITLYTIDCSTGYGAGIGQAEAAAFMHVLPFCPIVAAYLRSGLPIPMALTFIIWCIISIGGAHRLIPRRRIVFDSKWYLYYFRLSADNRLLFGGRAEYKQPTPGNTRRGMVNVLDLAS